MLDSQPGPHPIREQGPSREHDNDNGRISGIEWPTLEQNPDNRSGSVINFSTDTPHVQYPIPEQPHVEKSKEEEKRKRRIALGGAGLTVIALTSAILLSKGGGAAPNAGTETSASPIPSSEVSADVVTPEPYADPNLKVSIPDLPETQKSTEFVLGQEGLEQKLADEYLSDLLSSDLTYEGLDSSFNRIFLGGEWVFPKAVVGGGPQEDSLPTFNRKDDSGLAFRTHFATMLDKVRTCKEINHGKPCGFNVTIAREYGATPYPQYLKLADLSGEIPNQNNVRVNQTRNEAEFAEIKIIGFDMTTLKPLTDDELYLPLGDIYYKDATGKGHTKWIEPPAYAER